MIAAHGLVWSADQCRGMWGPDLSWLQQADAEQCAKLRKWEDETGYRNITTETSTCLHALCNNRHPTHRVWCSQNPPFEHPGVYRLIDHPRVWGHSRRDVRAVVSQPYRSTSRPLDVDFLRDYRSVLATYGIGLEWSDDRSWHAPGKTRLLMFTRTDHDAPPLPRQDCWGYRAFNRNKKANKRKGER